MADKPAQPNAGGGSFVDRIVTDPNNVPDVALLYGYPGASSEEGHERLYLAADLANFVEIPADAILHRVAAPREQDPNEGWTLWVRRDAALVYKMAPAAQALAHFFAGAIQAQGAPAAAPAGGVAAGPAALTFGGPICGVTLPAVCQIATAFCTRDTCGIACTAFGPCLTRGADCATQAATCACTEVGCPTDITPCVNTHANTCGACPSVIAVCQSVGIGCQSVGGDCTFIGCGHTLACTQGLLCRAAPPGMAAAAAAVPQPVPLPGPVPGPQPVPQPGPIASLACTLNSCGIACTAIGPCASVNATCAAFCTLFGPVCQSQAGPCVTVPPGATCGAQCTIGAACMSPFVPCVTVPAGATCGFHCTIAPPCASALVPCVTQVCTVPPGASCGIVCTVIGPNCQVTPITPACPPITPACPPPGSLACGGGVGPGPFAVQARMLPTQFAHCTQVCSQLPQMGCGHGCALNTVM